MDGSSQLSYQPMPHIQPATGLMIREAAVADTPKIEDHQQDKKAHRPNALTAWGLEISLLVLAIGLMVAIFLILGQYDKQELPDWGGSINLSALIAFLATILRASVAVVAFELLAQVKWNWISVGNRPLRHLERFDEASRGVYGALELLPLVAVRNPVALGAIIIAAVSLAIGPFSQLAIKTYACQRLGEGGNQAATITTANRIDGSKLWGGIRAPDFRLDMTLQSAMQDSVVNPSKDSNINSLYTCSSGNCSFPAYADNADQPQAEKSSHASVGLCSRCEDVYDLAEVNEYAAVGHSSFTLPVPANNLLDKNMAFEIRLGAQFSDTYLSVRNTGDLRWAKKVISNDMMNRARWSFMNLTIMAASQDHCEKHDDGNVTCPHDCDPKDSSCYFGPTAWGDPTDIVAATCIVYPCMRYYTAEVKNGKLSEKLVRDSPLRQQIPRDLWSAELKMTQSNGVNLAPWRGVQQPCVVNGTLYTSSNMSAAAKLRDDQTTLVLDHEKDFLAADPNEAASYANVTAPQECVAELPFQYIRAFYDRRRDLFDAQCIRATRHSDDGLYCIGTTGNEAAFTGSYLVSFLRNRTTTVESIREKIDSMTMRLTREMRIAGLGPRGTSRAAVGGQVWENTVCVSIAWEWLTLPASLCGLCAILLVWTLIQHGSSKRVPVWKGSILPFLLREHPGIEKLELKGLRKAARGLEVKLEMEED
ncbi:hypothetical protein FDECE_9470 [Fusarium decemcellulare]|nr:hypothetical protein FDECE_9470 [Fusarium decemcellulare]